tara:strand:- start:927 stop:1085 length:159 start_codon:yes stop_codon:yes gene_type:complete
MDPKTNLKDEVRAALLILHQKIDSFKEKVDKLCASTKNCSAEAPKSCSKEKK